MKFTKGLFLGTALGISAAMMLNNKSRSNTNNNNQTSSTAPQTEAQSNEYIISDII